MNELEVISHILCNGYTHVIKYDQISSSKKVLSNIYKITLKYFKDRESLANLIFVEMSPNEYVYGRPSTILINSSGRVLSFRIVIMPLE